MKTIIISDLHLGSRHCNTALLAKVLQHERFDRLILNGDTIDTLNFHAFTPEHWKTVELLRRIGKTRELVLIRGNHDHGLDCHQGVNLHTGTSQVLPRLLEVPFWEERELVFANQPYIVVHGDRFDPSLEFPMLMNLALAGFRLSTWISKRLAAWLQKRSQRCFGILTRVMENAVDYARDRNFTGIITGHTHLAQDVWQRGIHYLNPGSWTEEPCSYIVGDWNSVGLKQA